MSDTNNAAGPTRRIHVLKAFVFSLPGKAREGLTNLLPRERKFVAGYHDVGPEVYEHPHIARDFADGHIESPQQEAKRLADEQAELQKRIEAAAAAQKHAQEVLARMRPPIEIDDDLQKGLNTPVNELQLQQGSSAAAGVILTAEEKEALEDFRAYQARRKVDIEQAAHKAEDAKAAEAKAAEDALEEATRPAETSPQEKDESAKDEPNGDKKGGKKK